MIATTNRAQRVDQARQTALMRKPLPALLVIVRIYRDGWDGLGPDGSIVFDAPGVDRRKAIASLVRQFGP